MTQTQAQLELFQVFQKDVAQSLIVAGNGNGNGKNGKSTTPSTTATTRPWQYYEWFCSIAERQILKLLKKFQIIHLIPKEDVLDIARSAVVDLLHRYSYSYIAPSLIEKYTVNHLKRYLKCENPLIIQHTEKDLSKLI